jgi:hypothetical protein
MSIKTICAGIGALALIGGLAACGSSGGSAAAPTVTQTVVAPAAATQAPIIINQNNNAPAPAPTVTQTQTQTVPVYVPAPYVPSGFRAVGTGANGEEVYANSDTSDAFALSVESAYVSGGYWYQSGTSRFYAYSPVTGETYLMTSSSVGDPVVVTGGNNASVEFSL